MFPEYVTLVRSESVTDEQHGRHFGHHPTFSQRYPGRLWTYRVVEVPIDRLVCRYPSIGENGCPGLMAEIGKPDVDLRGARIIDIAHAVSEFLDSGQSFRPACSIARIQQLRGLDPITRFEQAVMVCLSSENAILVEGNHRCIAWALDGIPAVHAVLFEHVELQPA